jgi:hypothetical protein
LINHYPAVRILVIRDSDLKREAPRPGLELLRLENRNQTISKKCCFGANKVPISVRAARSRRQFQILQAFPGDIGIKGDERPCIPLPDEKGNRSAEADPALFIGNGEYAYDRDKEPPSQ